MKIQRIISAFFFLFILNGLIAQKIDINFINNADAFFKEQVVDGTVKYSNLKSNKKLATLIGTIEKADLTGSSPELKQAFYINAYNLLVINEVAQNYPLSSVQDIAGFFDKKRVVVAGQKVSLNTIEKDYLLKPFMDPRYHFVLVCGAVGCPPITNFAYHPDQLDQQLNTQTKAALNDDGFLKVEGKTVMISQIFNWYKKDFGGDKKSVVNFINEYRSTPIDGDSKFNYTNYDWLLNDHASLRSSINTPGGNNALRYVVSSTIKKGSVELKIFNNLYSEQKGSVGNLTDRSTFFTTSLSALYGLTNRFNIGINTRYRRVRNDNLPSSAFDVLGGGDTANSSRTGITAFGPQIRYAPVPKWTNFSIQSSFVFPIGNDLAGSNDQPYIDWTGATWNTQFFNDFSIGNSFSLFTEIDFLIEDIGGGEDHINRISTPATLIFSYNPIANMTLYSLGGYSPFWQSDFDYFVQYGLGFKYQFTPNLELELLYTDFSNQFLNKTGGNANTYNLGFRVNL